MWSYSGNPGASAKDATRLLCGDTDRTDPLLLDGEIQYLLDIYNQTPINAAIRACELIMAKFARMVDESVGQVSLKFSQRLKAYELMKSNLQQRLAIDGAIPYAGGISRSDVQQVNLNADRVRPDFTKHMMENDQISPWTTTERALLGDQWSQDEP